MLGTASCHRTPYKHQWTTAFSVPKAAAFVSVSSALFTRAGSFPSYFTRVQAAILQPGVNAALWSGFRPFQISTSLQARAGRSDLASSEAVESAESFARQSADGTDNPEGQNSSVGKVAQQQDIETNGAAVNKRNLGQLILKAAAAMIPHPEKAYRGGEDAYFIGEDGLSIGVADGVGGWAEENVDAGLYSRLLMKNCKQAAQEMPPSESRTLKILEEAHSHTDVRGSSTACLVTLEGDKLNAVNLGDSNVMVLRESSILFSTPSQQHQFNFPYQIAGPDCGSDPVTAADAFTISVQKGDVIVMATDGVTDNVFAEEAAALISVIHRRGDAPQVAATGLANYARLRSESKTRKTPFSVGAQQAGLWFQGGKVDDITVIVAYVTTASKL